MLCEVNIRGILHCGTCCVWTCYVANSKGDSALSDLLDVDLLGRKVSNCDSAHVNLRAEKLFNDRFIKEVRHYPPCFRVMEGLSPIALPNCTAPSKDSSSVHP